MKNHSPKSTILVISVGFIILYLFFDYKWAIYVALTAGLVGIFSDRGSEIIDAIWFKLSAILSKIIPSIILGVIFFLILFPLSLISKIFTKDPLMLENNYKSTFRDVVSVDIKVNMEKTW